MSVVYIVDAALFLLLLRTKNDVTAINQTDTCSPVTEHFVDCGEERVFALAAHRAREVIEVKRPDHHTAKIVLLYPVDLEVKATQTDSLTRRRFIVHVAFTHMLISCRL